MKERRLYHNVCVGCNKMDKRDPSNQSYARKIGETCSVLGLLIKYNDMLNPWILIQASKYKIKERCPRYKKHMTLEKLYRL